MSFQSQVFSIKEIRYSDDKYDRNYCVFRNRKRVRSGKFFLLRDAMRRYLRLLCDELEICPEDICQY